MNKKFVYVFAIVIFLSIFFYLGCQYDFKGVSDKCLDNKYLAVKNNIIGILETNNFNPLNVYLTIHSIAGITKPDNVLVLGKDENDDLDLNLYQVSFNNKTTECLLRNVKFAILCPDNNKILLSKTDYNSNNGTDRLFYLDLYSKKKIEIADNLIGKPFINKNCSKIAYTVFCTEGTQVEVYNLETEQKTRVESGQNLFSEGWIGENQLLIRVKPENMTQIDKFMTYNLSDGNWGESLFKGLGVHDIKNGEILYSYIDNSESKTILAICALNNPNNIHKLIEVPLYTNNFGYRSAVFYAAKFIGPQQVFYKVLTSENEDAVLCGIIDVKSKESRQLDISVNDVWGVFPF